MDGQRPQSDRHSFGIGMVAGAIMVGQLEVSIIDDDEGNHLDTFDVRIEGLGTFPVTVHPPRDP